MRSCTGAIVSLSARPGPSGSGSSSVSPWYSSRSRESAIAHDLDVLARALELAARSAGRASPRPPAAREEPIPRIMRPPESWSSVAAVIAVMAAERPGIWKIAEPSRIFVVACESQPRMVAASEP